MKNILLVICIIIVSGIGIYFTINHIEDKYQSVIAIAISTATIQLILFFLKQEFDRNSNKKTKAFGVIYDKKFINYHNLYDHIYLTKQLLHKFVILDAYNKSDEGAFESISSLKSAILSNRLLLSKEIYAELIYFHDRFNAIYIEISFIKAKIVSEGYSDIDCLDNELKENYYSNLRYLVLPETSESEISKIEKMMKKELHIE